MKQITPKHNKKILAVTHQLLNTGASIALMNVINLWKNSGYELEVISIKDGDLRKDIEELGIKVKIERRFAADAGGFYDYVQQFDLVIANTLVTYEAVYILNHTDIPVIWWIHEGEQYLERYRQALPGFAKLNSNIHIYSVSKYVQEAIRGIYGIETDLLPFEVRDVPSVAALNVHRSEKVRFMTIGMYSYIKAQDILAAAIELLPEECMDRAEFMFYGGEEERDEEVYASVRKLCKNNNNVQMCGSVSHDEILRKMDECDCLIVPSRFETMSAASVEMMMKRRTCLCTGACGIAYYIEDGRNGYVVPSENIIALAEKIKYIIEHEKEREQAAVNGRLIYEENFAPTVIDPCVLNITYDYTHPKENQMKALAGCIFSILDAEKKGESFSEQEKSQIVQSMQLVINYVCENYDVHELQEAEEIINVFACE